MYLVNPNSVLAAPEPRDPAATIIEPESPARHLAALRKAELRNSIHASRMETVINRLWMRHYENTYMKDLRDG